MNNDILYKKVNSLLEIYNDINKLVEQPVYNFIYNFEINYANMCEHIDDDAFAEAKLWQSEKCPESLYFSHKQYFKERGIQHVKDELIRKPKSKRAIISLLSQDKINESGDTPIPSFMVAQYAINENILYSTFYYRALEVSSFLKINLEEFSIMAREVTTNINVIRGTIISFYAYREHGFNNLKRNELDTCNHPKLVKILKNQSELCFHLRRMKQPSSVINSKGIKNILTWITDEPSKSMFDAKLTNPLIIEKFNDLVKYIDELEKLLASSSSVDRITAARNNVNSKIDEIIEFIKKG